MKQDVKHMYYDSKDGVNRGTRDGLSFNDDYKEKRAKEMTKGQRHHVQSLARGFKAFGKGMETGLTGVFVDPVRSAQREGAKGFFKCIGQGLPGTVVKPVVGTDDLATKTIDEVKYATTVFDQKRRGRVSALAELAGVFLCSLRCWHRCSISFNWPRRV
ncbi:putative vacuolar sorting protein [Blattamonas nauphoetae]|nr:putative vacuolar sorting protein [Blattamonas nauphoetae]